MPTLLSWTQSVFVTDLKGELWITYGAGDLPVPFESGVVNTSSRPGRMPYQVCRMEL